MPNTSQSVSSILAKCSEQSGYLFFSFFLAVRSCVGRRHTRFSGPAMHGPCAQLQSLLIPTGPPLGLDRAREPASRLPEFTRTTKCRMGGSAQGPAHKRQKRLPGWCVRGPVRGNHLSRCSTWVMVKPQKLTRHSAFPIPFPFPHDPTAAARAAACITVRLECMRHAPELSSVLSGSQAASALPFQANWK